MDDIVKQALLKWPDVPHCRGWLGLDARGNWYLRDAQAQALGAFASGVAGAKGALLRHDRLINFIGRNYAADAQGQWFFQNGPQRVYVELQATPLICRLHAQPVQPPQNGAAASDSPAAPSAEPAVTTHHGHTVRVQACWLDETGHLYLQTPLGLGLVHTQDMAAAADAVQAGLWQPQATAAAELPQRFGYVRSPQALQSL